MPDALALVRRWRAEAEDLRRLADSIDFPPTRAGMMHAAANYARMADELEQLLRERGSDARQPADALPAAP